MRIKGEGEALGVQACSHTAMSWFGRSTSRMTTNGLERSILFCNDGKLISQVKYPGLPFLCLMGVLNNTVSHWQTRP
ncbi:MAG: hypothetical protein H0X47_02990 [Nitrospirales bacterium]|nr:hypothetical protein [Nitrospirales bacterium]